MMMMCSHYRTYARTDTNSVAFSLRHPLPTSLSTPFLRSPIISREGLPPLNGNKRKFKNFEFFQNPIVLIPTHVSTPFRERNVGDGW